MAVILPTKQGFFSTFWNLDLGAASTNMDLSKDFPFKLFINLGNREDRRNTVELQFYVHGLEVKRKAAIKADWVADCRGYRNASRYACALSKALSIREARIRGVEAVLIFEDDVVLDEDFQAKAEALELPDDWGIFYFGCMHVQRPKIHSSGIVRVAEAYDNHAFAIRRPFYNEAIRALLGTGKGQPTSKIASDVELARLHEKIPTYAAFPNLAWQGVSRSSILNKTYSNYDTKGRQLLRPEVVDGLDLEIEKFCFPERFGLGYESLGSEEVEPVVECIVGAWRPGNLEPILRALRSQSVPCRITVVVANKMVDGSKVSEKSLRLADRVFRSSQNFGCSLRYLPSFLADTEFVYIHDDDMLPGPRTLEHFIQNARELGEFGILGQEGRRMSPTGEYDSSSVPSTSTPQEIDVVVRGYFMEAKRLPLVLQARMELGLSPADDLEDDLILAYAMKKNGLGCYLTSTPTDEEGKMNQAELSSASARFTRPGHRAVRNEFVMKHLFPLICSEALLKS